ncbi:MAG: substrate-binding domain-containing protein, partial [Aggregatilineales bacterium]
MKRAFSMLAILMVAAFVLATGPVSTASAQTPQIVIYMQMGGNQGDPSVLARTNGAEAAAKALGIKLVEQYAGWDPQTMINQFKTAIAAKPDGIEIMGHPGEDAMGPLVDQAEAAGIIVTSGNNPLPNIEAKYQSKGFGYAGADLHAGGMLTGQAMVAAGLKSGDHALVYDIWHNQSRSVSSQGIVDALTAAGVVVDKLDVTNDVDTNASLAIPVLTAYIAAHPDLKAIGTQHGNITATLPKVLQQAGKKPGDIIVGGIDLGPATIAGI